MWRSQWVSGPKIKAIRRWGSLHRCTAHPCNLVLTLEANSVSRPQAIKHSSSRRWVYQVGGLWAQQGWLHRSCFQFLWKSGISFPWNAFSSRRRGGGWHLWDRVCSIWNAHRVPAILRPWYRQTLQKYTLRETQLPGYRLKRISQRLIKAIIEDWTNKKNHPISSKESYFLQKNTFWKIVGKGNM